MSGYMPEGEIFRRLRVAFPNNQGWVLIPQVPDGTGARKRRTADAIGMQVYPSRGLEIHGFEIKSSRGDWRTELRAPDKAESVAAFCHRWWIAAPKGVVPVEEVPAAWGLLEVEETRVLRTRKAPPQDHVEPVTYTFLAGLLRAAERAVTPQAELDATFADGHRKGLKDAEERIKSEKARHDRLAERVKAFEKASGVKIHDWRKPEDIGSAVRIVLEGGSDRERHALERLAEQADAIAERIRAALGNEVPA